MNLTSVAKRIATEQDESFFEGFYSLREACEAFSVEERDDPEAFDESNIYRLISRFHITALNFWCH